MSQIWVKGQQLFQKLIITYVKKLQNASAKIFLLGQCSDLLWNPSSLLSNRALPHKLKSFRHEAVHLPPFTAEIKTVSSHTSILHIVLN